MPVTEQQREVIEVDAALQSLFTAPANAIDARLRDLFVGIFDFGRASGTIALPDKDLPANATRIAAHDGVNIVALQLPEAGRVSATKVRRALRRIGDQLGGETLLAATDAERTQWHFVYPTTKGGREMLRRMVIHRGQPYRTVAEQLAKVYHDTQTVVLQRALENAYDVEAVTKEFFKTYRRIFDRVMGLLRASLPDDEERKKFCQILFNRLMFLYFLQRKGWLTFGGSQQYFEELWKAGKGDKNFYDSRLRLLFFTALSNERSTNFDRAHPLWEDQIGVVPFLNGGLFEESDLDKRPGVVVPNAAIGAILEELFAPFNFTIAESTPYDVQVAVDPEMLGKVFEELVTGRHESGSYYTPRPIVAFMCREALKGHLTTAVPGLIATLAAALVDDHDVGGLTMVQAGKILAALETVTAVDPACGSGAYLLGMMQELIDLQRLLYSSDLIHGDRELYDLKLRVIERNLYGVDIDQVAVNIAMLRLWLSLIIDYNAPGDPPALPNLAFKILCGDSLLAPNPQPSLQPSLFRKQAHESTKELAKLKAAFLRETGEAKRHLGEQIEAAQERLRGSLSYVPPGSIDWRVAFTEVFDGRDGFDIVMANPPYVRADAQFKHIAHSHERQIAIASWKANRVALKSSENYETLHQKWDLYVPFLERAHQLLHNSGEMIFIIPDAYNIAKYAGKSHGFFLKCSTVARIDFCSDIPIFQAGVSNTIVHFSKRVPNAAHIPYRVRHWGEHPDDFEKNSLQIETLTQMQSGVDLFRPNPTQPSHVSAQTIELRSLCYISVDMVINADEDGHLGAFSADDLLSPVPDKYHPKRFALGKDIAKWQIRRVRYLEWGTRRAPHHFRRATFTQLQDASTKLIAMRTPGKGPKATYDSESLHFDASSVGFVPWHALSGVRNKSIKKVAKYRDEGLDLRAENPITREELEEVSKKYSLKFILAVMNSAYVDQWLFHRRRSKVHIYPDDWKSLPIPLATASQQEQLAQLVDEMLTIYRSGTNLSSSASQERLASLEQTMNQHIDHLYEGDGG